MRKDESELETMGENEKEESQKPFPTSSIGLQPFAFASTTNRKTRDRFSRHLQAAPPPRLSVAKSPSTLGHALSLAPVVLRRLGLGEFEGRFRIAKPHPPLSSPRTRASLVSPPPAQPGLRAALARGRSANPPAVRLPVCRTHPLRPAPAVPSLRRLRCKPAGPRRLLLLRGRGPLPMAAAGCRRPSV